MGLGLFRSGGTTGGTDLAARIIHRYLKLSVGQALMAVDAVVIMLAGLVLIWSWPYMLSWPFSSPPRSLILSRRVLAMLRRP